MNHYSLMVKEKLKTAQNLLNFEIKNY